MPTTIIVRYRILIFIVRPLSFAQSAALLSHVLFRVRNVTIDYPPRQPGGQIINLPNTPSLPNLISQFLINQQGFDIDFGEHG